MEKITVLMPKSEISLHKMALQSIEFAAKHMKADIIIKFTPIKKWRTINSDSWNIDFLGRRQVGKDFIEITKEALKPILSFI